MKKISLVFIGALIVLLAVLPGCSSSNSPATSPSNKATGANSITIQGFAFSPEVLTINKGETVTWTNNDSAVHNVVGGILKSNDLAKGQTFSYTFSETGTFDYICTHHSSMKGKIIVK